MRFSVVGVSNEKSIFYQSYSIRHKIYTLLTSISPYDTLEMKKVIIVYFAGRVVCCEWLKPVVMMMIV